MKKTNITKSIIILGCLFGITTSKAQFTQSAKIVSENRESRAEYGTSVAINNEFAIVGASRETFASGAAYIYAKDIDGNWNFTQRLEAFDPNDGAEFGGGAKFSNDYLVVAAGRADVNGLQRTGALYVYDYQNNNWEFSTKLVASDFSGDAKLGMNPTSLDVEGNTIVAGAPGDNSWMGAAYVFTNNGGIWEESQKIVSPASQGSDVFGIGVSISGDYLAIGASEVDGRKGAVYMYMKDTNGVWEHLQTLVASDASNDSFFGNSVSMSGDQLVVGAYGANLEEGAAYVFEKNTQGEWIELQKFIGNSSTEPTQFGWSTDIMPNYITISAPHIFGFEQGEVYFYKKETNGSWVEDQIIVGNDTVGEDFYGWSIAMHENQLIAGAPWEDHDVNGGDEIDRAGSAYIFENPNILGGTPNNYLDTFTVYPVPARNTITIEGVNLISKIKVINQLGMTIKAESVANSKKYTLDISTLTQGVYFIDVYNMDGNKTTQKIVKLN